MTTLVPKDVTEEELETLVQGFCDVHCAENGTPVVLVSSGGTAVDLELHTVRTLENFSTGRRGALSVEAFLRMGYAVIHLWRPGSVSPYGHILSEAAGSGAAQAAGSNHSTPNQWTVDSIDDYLQLPSSSSSKRHKKKHVSPWSPSPVLGETPGNDVSGMNIFDRWFGLDKMQRRNRRKTRDLFQEFINPKGYRHPSLIHSVNGLIEEEEERTVTEDDRIGRENDVGGDDRYDDIDGTSDSFREMSLSPQIVMDFHVRTALQQRRMFVVQNRRLLTVPFRTVEEYLERLQFLSKILGKNCGRMACLYLAAAVSDFYIPHHIKSTHKIQSSSTTTTSSSSSSSTPSTNSSNNRLPRTLSTQSEDTQKISNRKVVEDEDDDDDEEEDETSTMTLEFHHVPKQLGQLRTQWAPQAFVVSFKLETHPDMLEHKALHAIRSYDVHLVCANLLQHRNEWVSMISNPKLNMINDADSSSSVPYDGGKSSCSSSSPSTMIQKLTRHGAGPDSPPLEDAIVQYVIEQHFVYMSQGGYMEGGIQFSPSIDMVQQREELLKRQKQRQWEQQKMKMLNSTKQYLWLATEYMAGMLISYYGTLFINRRLRGYES
jgi:phosphopantothenoylcysteine synthetase/decarboxylase